MKNNYIDTSVQKGGIPGFPGFLKHTGVVTQILREAREGRGDLAVLWLDLAIAYGSIPYKLVEEALKRHHVPGKINELILGYYENFQVRISSRILISDWHRFERGIITGWYPHHPGHKYDFEIGWDWVSRSNDEDGSAPAPDQRIHGRPAVTITSVMGSRWTQRSLEKLIAWVSMKIKPAKSRLFVVKKGRTADKSHLSIAGTMIPTSSVCPVKSLGKIFNITLRDTNTIRAAVADLELARVDKSGLPGHFKAFIYQQAVPTRILWPLFLYDFPMTIVEAMERKINCYPRWWLGLLRSLSSAALYGTSDALQHPFKGLMEEFVVSWTKEAML